MPFGFDVVGRELGVGGGGVDFVFTFGALNVGLGVGVEIAFGGVVCVTSAGAVADEVDDGDVVGVEGGVGEVVDRCAVVEVDPEVDLLELSDCPEVAAAPAGVAYTTAIKTAAAAATNRRRRPRRAGLEPTNSDKWKRPDIVTLRNSMCTPCGHPTALWQNLDASGRPWPKL